ncbi:uncharacterized protein CMC5_024900 [Chondromyces crocatus]|uniref:Uncharacterized protein n=1 Tax=Chondromyces crocatus TaxID=52 RepID=A0A0K1EBW3_CHOCO|nr:uncharacterized protein CMC5_024900 [Chondromyces crocatus]
MRLALNRGALALELAEPFQLGPFSLTELVVRIPGLRFPLDLSGGVARFRHRRGALERLVLEVRTTELGTWLTPRLRGLLGAGPTELEVAPLRGSAPAPRLALPGQAPRLASSPGVLLALRVGEAALAFDVVIAPGERDLRLIPERARGVGLGAPPHALALQALMAGSGPGAQLLGGAVVVADAVARVVREAMPAAGARAPAVDAVRWTELTASAGTLRFEAVAEAPPPALDDRTLSALEAAEIAADGDRAAAEGDLDAARQAYLSALERAPRHRELATRVAWIDCVVGERAEAALATLVEAMPAVDAGVLGAELLEAVGDRDAAFTALERAAHGEPYGPLSALGWLRAARLSETPAMRLQALDEGVARAPLLAELRWARLEARLDVADARGAMADAEHLEAATRGAQARHAVWRRAAEAYLARGHAADARRLFERALRYAPDSPEAALGLGRSLRAAGEGRRALDLLARARALAERRGQTVGALELELARGLAELANDRPAAIARVHGIPPGTPEALEARLLEGRWRAELGDPEGASLCLSRLRAAVEMGSAELVAGPEASRVASLLAEAAEIEERERGDLLAAQLHLGLAMRLSPRHPGIGAAFRRVTAELKRPAPPPRPAPLPAAPSSASHRDPYAGARDDEFQAADHHPQPAAPAPRTAGHEREGATHRRHARGHERHAVELTPEALRAPRLPAWEDTSAEEPTYDHEGLEHEAHDPSAPYGYEQIAGGVSHDSSPGDEDDSSPDDEDELPSSEEASTPHHDARPRPPPQGAPQAWWTQPEDEVGSPAGEPNPEDEQLVERLTERLRADPHDQQITLDLAAALARLGRDLDLLALLSARIEEGDDAVRDQLTPLRREVLQRLSLQARAAGRTSEAELYEMMLEMP